MLPDKACEAESSLSPFVPEACDKIEDLDIPQTLVEDLMVRRLYMDGSGSILSMSNSLGLAVPIIRGVFERLRKQHLFEVTGMTGYNYFFTLSGKGREHAAKCMDMCMYAGRAPVSIRTYQKVVKKQASKIKLSRRLLEEALSDLVLTDKLLDQLGPALVSQNSIFLYGPTGNGKTSVMRRLSKIYRDAVAVPYAVEFDGQIIVLYDPAVHEKIDVGNEHRDARWVLCRRPFVLVGGELEPSMLELKLDENSGIYAAPIQMKANNGILGIDDFGRQILSPEYLLNRWIIPLDRRIDFLALRYGVKFEIPFEIMVVFSTNLDPQRLTDEAFLRRIQNKIYVEPIGSQVFDEILRRIANERNLCLEGTTAAFLREICLRWGPGELRACYPADILNIVDSISIYEDREVEITRASLERAASIYFTKTTRIQRDRAPRAVEDERGPAMVRQIHP